MATSERGSGVTITMKVRKTAKKGAKPEKRANTRNRGGEWTNQVGERWTAKKTLNQRTDEAGRGKAVVGKVGECYGTTQLRSRDKRREKQAAGYKVRKDRRARQVISFLQQG